MASPFVERLVASDRSNTWWQRDLSISYKEVGDVLKAQGKLDEALKSYGGLAIANAWPPPIAAIPSGSAFSRCRTTEIGDVLKAQGKLDEALKAYRDSLAIRERSAASDRSNTEWQRDLSLAYDRSRRRARGAGQARRGAQGLPGRPRHRLSGWPPPIAAIPSGSAISRFRTKRSATCCWRRASSTRRSRAYRDGLAIRERLAAPTAAIRVAARSVDFVRQGRRRAGGAGQARRGAQDLPGQPRHPRALAATDRSNTEWQRDLSVSYDKVGDVLMAQGKLDEALKAYRDGLAIRERLAATDRSNTEWQRDLSVSYDKVGDVLVAQGKLDEALKAYRDGLAIRERLAATDPQQYRAGSAISRSRTRRSATCWWRRASSTRRSRPTATSLAIRERLAAADRSNTDWQRDLSVSLQQDRRRAGGAGQARRGAQEPTATASPSASASPPPIAAIPSGSAISRSRTRRSATCWWRRASSTRRSRPTATASPFAERLAAADRSNTGWQRDLSVSYDKVGDVLVAQGKLDEALKSLPRRPRHPRAPGRRRSQQYRVAARSLGLVRQGRQRAGGAGQARRGAQGLPR